MRYIALIVLALALAACSSSRPPARHAPAVPPSQCAREMRAWLATNDGGGDAAGPPTVWHNLSEAITAARDYGRRSSDSPDAAGDMGTEDAEFQRLSYVSDPPACADPGGLWQILTNDISFAGGGNGDSSVTNGMQDIPDAVGSFNGELRHTAPGVQIGASLTGDG